MVKIWKRRADGVYQRYNVKSRQDHRAAPPDLARALSRAASQNKPPNKTAPSPSAVRRAASQPTRPSTKPPTRDTPTHQPTRKRRSAAQAGAAAPAGSPSRGAKAAAQGVAFVPLRGATYSTWFKAIGTGNRLSDMRGASPSPGILQEDLAFAPAPAAFYSNEGAVLGRVKWQGIVSEEALIAELNAALQFAGEEVDDFDFRVDYEQWEYTYRVREHIGETSNDVIVVRRGKPKPSGAGVKVRSRRVE